MLKDVEFYKEVHVLALGADFFKTWSDLMTSLHHQITNKKLTGRIAISFPGYFLNQRARAFSMGGFIRIFGSEECLDELDFSEIKNICESKNKRTPNDVTTFACFKRKRVHEERGETLELMPHIRMFSGSTKKPYKLYINKVKEGEESNSFGLGKLVPIF